jgi:hypothetical protein
MNESKILNFALWLFVGTLGLAMAYPIAYIFIKTLGII